MKNLAFREETRQHIPCLVAGDDQYKVVEYGDNFYAFFRPAGWKSFGNSCAKNRHGKSAEYATAAEAQAACRQHYATYGDSPDQNASIKEATP